jgi:putative addiction module CopG family antidote
MTITLKPEQEERIRELVERGTYQDADEAIDDAIRLMDRKAKQERLDALLQEGLDDLARGDVYRWHAGSMDEILREADEEDRLGLPLDLDGIA